MDSDSFGNFLRRTDLCLSYDLKHRVDRVLGLFSSSSELDSPTSSPADDRASRPFGSGAKKIYRLKEDQAFSLSLELGLREKVARHPSADFLLNSVGGGGDFVDTVIAVKILVN